jgi:hypothetical protein
MSKFTHSRRALIALAVVVAIIAVAYPTCRMVGCSASSYAMQGHTGSGMLGLGAKLAEVPRIMNDCGGQFIAASNSVGVMPAGIESLLFALTAALVAGIALMVPRVSPQLVLVPLAEPPPPPLEPRGERFLL